PSLWTWFITSIHGSRGALDCTSFASRKSPWLDIIRDISFLKSKGIDLLGFSKKKVGNGEKSPFWDDLWIGKDGGVEEEQFGNLSLCTTDFILPQIEDRWVWSLSSTVESASHLFFSFPMARQVWRKVLRWWELTDPWCSTYDDWLNWLDNSQMAKGIKDIFEGVCYVTWWILWAL
ncbi:hypothetical protein Tco_1161782, partial [Tanacetum coccineum]